ncbi:hypothetical protein BZG36_04149 [Bifiguratus adelaidae]|uniref:Uncharacterized protein n=1 Tax=Bifiguratus adelaidae TaxID=1938954 RepID=A0A261XZG2_9FUNG|nr:hypothetical protein BZG36_04149 [Bifiguratus adelaidae]
MGEKLSEYEKERLENIRRNKAILQELDLQPLSNHIKPATPPKAKETKRKAPKREKKEVTVPQRVSLRLKGIAAAPAKPENGASAYGSSLTEVAPKRRRIEGDLTLQGIESKITDEKDTKGFLNLLSGLSHHRDLGGEEEGPREISAKVPKSLLTELQSLSVRHEWRTVKVTPERIYACVFHPSPQKVLAIAGDKLGNIGFWDVNGFTETTADEDDEESEKEPVVYAYQPHARTISCLLMNPADSTKLLSSSYDNSIRVFDMQKQSFVEAFVPDDDIEIPFCSIDTNREGNTIYFSTQHGEVGFHDTREKLGVFKSYQIAPKKIGCIQLNPIDNNYMVTSCNDKTVNIWDKRKMISNSRGTDKPISIFSHSHSYAATAAYWSPDGRSIASTGYDDRIKLYSASSEKAFDYANWSLGPDIRHDNHTGQWVTMFRATWTGNKRAQEHPYFVIGNMRRFVDIYSGVTGDLLVQLEDQERISAVPAVNAFHPSTPNITLAQPTVAELGELGVIQFRDLNPDVNAFQRAFVNEIRRLDELERQLRFFDTNMAKMDIQARPAPELPYSSRARRAQEIDDLADRIREHEARIIQMNESHETLQKRYLELTELRHVLRETAVFFEEVNNRQEDIRGSFDESDTAPLLENDIEQQATIESSQRLNIGYVTGVIARNRLQTFERVLWRSLRGNLYMNTADIDEPIVDPATDELVEKTVFIIFAHGTEVINKIRKISDSMGANLYAIDDTADKRREATLEVTARIEDLNNVLSNTNNTRRAELTNIADNSAVWTIIVKKEKATYHTMNLFNYDVGRKCLIAEGWCATNDIPVIQNALKTATESTGSNLSSILTELHTTKKPPTYHRTNKFTEGFQNLIDSYGVARYREVNPGLFTIISFPFLFAVMFGDVGHGFLMLLAALYMVLNEKQWMKRDLGEITSMFFGGRYLILLMAAFSIYTGFIYNDMFSQSLHIFKSGWDWPAERVNMTVEAVSNGHVYAIGLDPAWHAAKDNNLIFTNSYKMKQAIVLGVIHMTFAICLQVYNHAFYGHKEFIWAEFLPQILFMESIFGYLVLCIVYKWSVNWWELDADGNHIHNSPPSLLNMLIYMFLKPGTVDASEQLYPGQATIQTLLILIAVVCVPWMLLVKPYLMKWEHNKHKALGYQQVREGDNRVSYEDEDDNGAGTVIADDSEEEEFDFSEEMIHQTIHTIEFCLNCISNTASYLRLWALSLAHAQLSSVLWSMTIANFFGVPGIFGAIGLVVAFAVWINGTVGILIFMEGLSAFLHALRLHWVEFNGKFYYGDGIMFEPFSFKAILEAKSA